jgi:putative acetyltransferase
MKDVFIRPEKKVDIDAIRRVHETAFGSLLEAELVDNLQAEGDAVRSLVAWCEGEVVGHVMFSRLRALESRGLRATALAPLGVLPKQQRRGFGTALVRDGLERLKREGEDLVLVVGDPNYYGRFGFTAKAAKAFQTPYDGPHMQALALSEAGHIAEGLVRYAPAFAMLA